MIIYNNRLDKDNFTFTSVCKATDTSSTFEEIAFCVRFTIIKLESNDLK